MLIQKEWLGLLFFVFSQKTIFLFFHRADMDAVVFSEMATKPPKRSTYIFHKLNL